MKVINIKKMSVRCPNYEICNNNLEIINEECEDGNMDNKVNIKCSPVLDDDGKYTLLKINKPIPVCWVCGSIYSDVENEHKNKYLNFIESTECCICLNRDRGVSFPNCLHYTCIPCHTRCWFGPPRPKEP